MSVASTVTTFYSYKGGTGRTMALANIAVLLARRAEGEVLVVDWDLEAPGLHRFFAPHLEGDVDAPPGLIEMFIEVSATLDGSEGPADDDAVGELWREIAPERRYLLETDLEGIQVLKAGRFDEEYAEKVNTFNWEALYNAAPSLFGAFAAHLGERFRYVLIDSRTGITDSSGICTMLLPDQLVVVFTPNWQSLAGVIDVVERATTYRKSSDDVRPLLVYPLASRVEVSEPDLKDLWRLGEERAPLKIPRRLDGQEPVPGYEPTFEELFKKLYDLDDCRLDEYFDEVQIQHASHFAYGEEIAVVERSETDRLSIANSYVRFCEALLDPQGPWGFKPKGGFVEDDQRAGAALTRLDDALRWHRGQARLVRQRQRALRAMQATGVVLAAILLAAQWQTGQLYFLWGAVGLLVLTGLLEVARGTAAPERNRVVHERTAQELERERYLFDTHAGVYADTSAPARLLAERVAVVLEDAEKQLIEQRGTVAA
jgi:cellulose biosynthesis protein BcsQ